MSRPHPEGYASLVAAVLRAVARPRPVAAFGCLPFTPDRDFTRDAPLGPLVRTSDTRSDPKDGPLVPLAARPPARGPCPICGRPLHLPGPVPDPGGPDYLDCGGCSRASVRVDARLADELRRDRQHRHLVAHNRQLTASTPTPAILLEAEPPAPPAAAPKPGKKRKVPC